MLSIIVVSILGLIISCNNRILLYDTENTILSSSERFDCIYVLDNVGGDHGGSSAGKVPYCRRPSATEDFQIITDECQDGSETKYFVDLLQNGIRPFEVLQWSSSVEKADEYAAIYYSNYSSLESVDQQHFLCHCMHPGVFGKHCEYQLTHESDSFEVSHSSQVMHRAVLLFYHQIFGDILCYTTLSCNSGLLCLDWRNICDGEQQCENGWDEENCDKLEFNECEEDEYRCSNGMCIPEEYWLDGDKDCMDWSDENFYDSNGHWCFQEIPTIDCNEHICIYDLWSCGDGQCINWYERLIFQKFLDKSIGCNNLRNMNYMCELNTIQGAWTMSNGLCWFLGVGFSDPESDMSNVSLSDNDKCIYLIRCALSDGIERDCQCNRFTCLSRMLSVCQIGKLYRYPLGPLLRPYISMYHDWTSDFSDKTPILVKLSGSIRCRGYYGFMESSPQNFFLITLQSVTIFRWDSIVCSYSTILKDLESPIKYDNDCWKDSLTFNDHFYAVQDVCNGTSRCISQYRINDGWADCLHGQDEKMFVNNKDLCNGVRRHRFQCSIEEPTCLPSSMLGISQSHCSNGYDIYLNGHDRSIAELTCRKSKPANCQLLKEYIKNSSIIPIYSNRSSTNRGSRQSTGRIPFRSYCDSIWHLQGHIDELPQYCREWICHRDQYQCKTGQCIPLEWVCDKQWDCADASDEEAILTIHEWSPHNNQVQGLNETHKKCVQYYSYLPLSDLCNTTIEFPCLRSNVSDPLNLTQNRPCIPYSKIGDEIEDCYNAYDEKNTLESDADGTMWGFALRCGKQSVPYFFACAPEIDECARMFCPYRQNLSLNCSKPTDAICIDDQRCVPDGRCNGIPECDHGEDEYWCAPKNLLEQGLYRYNKIAMKDNHQIFDGQTYPQVQPETRTSTISPKLLLLNSIKMASTLPSSHIQYVFWCNRGVAVIMLDQVVCFCSPPYFGKKCQFFSDRITVITHLNLTTWNPIKSIKMPTLFKIQVHFLFNGSIIDHYEFHSNPSIEILNYIKHKFYLLYPRSNQFLSHKKTRFFNRTDIEHNHPYSVHFNIYALYNNQSIPIPLGSWHYPIYFDFLPAFRLATVLRFPHWLGNSSFNPCTKHTCNPNSTCQPIFNQNNSYLCVCKSGFYGKNCSQYDYACDSYCSPHSFCQSNNDSLINNTSHPFCICPFEHFGPRCFLKFEQCKSNPCLNNGSCLYTYEASGGGDTFVCNCSKFFYGDRCQYVKMAIYVRLNSSSIDDLPRASTIQFYDVDLASFQLYLHQQQLVQGFPFSISYAHGLVIAPALGVLKAYYDSIEPKYFIIYLKPNTSSINISSSPEHCPLASTLLETDDLSGIPNVFRYHHICRNNNQTFCFFDNDYLCICQLDHNRTDCFIHDTQIDRCTKCRSNGKCVRGDIHEIDNFICLCPRCHRGQLCEFNIQAFGFTFDALLIDSSKIMKIFYVSIAFLLFFIGLFNNFCSFLTFKRPLPRKVGVGNYLLIITCFNQMSLLCLLGKFIQITFEITNLNSCKFVPYLFSVFTRLTYWLASWVTIDRLFIIFFPTSTVLKKPSLSIGVSIVTIICLFGMHIHEFIYYTTIQHLSTGSSICVTNFDTDLIFMYNRVSTLIHYLLPFIIQAISITLLIILAARSRTKTTGGKMTFYQVLIKQFRTQKELYTTPIIIIVSALPQNIFTFSFACVELTDVHRHTLLVTYLLSYIPQILGFILYVLPSTTYKKEFSETQFAKKYMGWMVKKTQNTMTISKRKC